MFIHSHWIIVCSINETFEPWSPAKILNNTTNTSGSRDWQSHHLIQIQKWWFGNKKCYIFFFLNYLRRFYFYRTPNINRLTKKNVTELHDYLIKLKHYSDDSKSRPKISWISWWWIGCNCPSNSKHKHT